MGGASRGRGSAEHPAEIKKPGLLGWLQVLSCGLGVSSLTSWDFSCPAWKMGGTTEGYWVLGRLSVCGVGGDKPKDNFS